MIMSIRIRIRRNNILYWSVIITLLLISLLISSHRLSSPGYYYDELLFVNAALSGDGDLFISKRFYGIPFMLMDYIGAIKAWIYYPIFKAYDVNPFTIRFPAIILSCIGSILIALAMKNLFGKITSIVSAALLLFDPALILFSRLDLGPVCLMYFFRGLLMYGFSMWIKSSLPQGIWISIIALILGIYDKLNFIWFLFAFLAAFILADKNKIKTYYNANKITSIFQATIFSVLTIGTFWYAQSINNKMIVNGNNLCFNNIFKYVEYYFCDRIPQALLLLKYTFFNAGCYKLIYSDHLFSASYLIIGYSVLIVAFFINLKLLDFKTFRRWFLLSVFILVAIALFSLTRLATAPWHSALLCGYPVLILSPICCLSLNTNQSRRTKIISSISFLPIIIAMLFVNYKICESIEFPTNPNWDQATTNLALYFEKDTEDPKVITVDWGCATQILSLNRGRLKVEDHWPSFTNKDTALWLLKTVDFSKKNYFVIRNSGYEVFPDTEKNFFYAIKKLNLSYREVAVFKTIYGKPIYTIVEINRSKQG
jgi:hypothetical protein